jgi:hypothetical protein
MQVIEFKEKNITKYLPEDLSECDTVQYIELSALVFLLQTGQLTYEQFRIHAFYKLLNMKAVNQKVNDLDKAANIYQYSQLLDTFFELPNEKNKDEPRTLKLYFTKNPIPKFLGYLRNYYGPKNDFDDITFGEYLDMLEEFVNFNQTNEMSYLHRLLAIGYRPKQILSKKRVPYNTNQIQKRANQFKGQHIGIVWGFYLFVASFVSYLSDCKLFVQGNEIDLSILFTSNEKDNSDISGLGMKTVLISIAESGTYGDLEKVRNTNIWEVFTYMYYVTKKNLDQEKQLKKSS